MPFVTPEVVCNLQWRNTTRQLVFAKQGEFNSRKVLVQLYDGSNRFTFTNGTYTGEFAYRRPDGQGRAYSAIEGVGAVSLNGDTGTATITLEPEVLAVAGIVECELRLKTQNSLLATFTFGYFVEQAVVDNSTPSPSPGPDPTPVPTTSQTKFFGFASQSDYDAFVRSNPGVLVDGDIVVLTSASGGNTLHTFYVLVSGNLTNRYVITVPQGGSSGASTLSALGGGYGVCSSLKATVAKIVRIDGFVRTQSVPFLVKFNYDVQGGDTLNVRSSSSTSSGTGACTLRWNGANVPAGLITAGSTATLVYDGTYYQVLDVSPTPTALIPNGAITEDKLAESVKPLVGSTGNTTPAQVATALSAGRPVSLSHVEGTAAYTFTAWGRIPSGGVLLSVGFGVDTSGNIVTISGATTSWTFATYSGGSGGSGTLQHAYGFISQAAYEAFVQEYPTAIQPGDFIYITDRAQNNVSVKIYQRNDLGTLNQIITTIGDSYIVTLTESSGTWSASHDGSPVTFANIVSSGVNEGKRIVAYIPSLALYIPADFIFTTGSDQYIQFDAVTFNGTVRMGQSFVINSSGVQADIKALGKVIVHATTQDGGQSYLVDYYASQIITMRQYDANIVLVDSLTGDEYPLIGDNGSTAAYFGGFNRGMTKTVLFTVFNTTNVPSKSEVAYPPSGGGGGGGVSKLTVTIRNSAGSYVSSHSPAEIAAAISNGDVVEVDCSGIMGWITGADASGASALSIAVDGGTKSLEMWSIDTDKSVVLITQDIGDAYKPVTETLNGATPTISYASDNRIYKGGELSSLTVNNLISNGMFVLIFDSGSTATNLVLPEYDAQHPTAAYVKKPDGFTIEANKHYELSVNCVDGVGYLVGQGW